MAPCTVLAIIISLSRSLAGRAAYGKRAQPTDRCWRDGGRRRGSINVGAARQRQRAAKRVEAETEDRRRRRNCVYEGRQAAVTCRCVEH